jgi:hypothetical protein
MTISLYDLSVLTFLQTMRAVSGFLDRAAKHCAETGADPDDFVRARLYPDMAPFHFQIEAAWHHSVWGLEAVKTGAFSPPILVGPVPFANLQAMIGKAETALESFTPDEVNGWAGKDLDLQSARGRSRSRRRASSSRFRCPTSISMPSPPTTSCAHAACPSASATTRAGCVPSRL